jgi:hypothetical protein
MPGIYIISIITTILVVVIIGAIIFRKLPRNQYRFMIAAILLQLPMSYVSFHFFRIPFDKWFHSLFTSGQDVYRFLTIFYAPIFEEPFKLLPLLIPVFYRNINKENFVKIALALGLGFGIGEIWFLAHSVAVSQPAVANLPWYQLTGFLNERAMVCFMHGAFTSVTLYTLSKSKSWVGILGSMTLHYFGNFPIYLMGINFLNLGKPTWQWIVSIYIMVYFVGMIMLLAYFSFHKWSQVTRLIYGQVKCPECHQIYNPPLIGVNWITKRYERCPHCKHWHWVGRAEVAS